ncbi:2OG-Fe(II) oxygenase [Sphingomonas oligophenolica]|uniref:2OG-Fe(II) oxygenase n=1 Tax=Sphingomonas oligophenolica TaxID=301154 RepID=A0ABU9Y8H6_9SPHN
MPKPDRLIGIPSPIVVGLQRTEIRGDPADFAESFERHRAIAFSDMIDTAFFNQLLKLCSRAQFVADTATDIAQRQRETPGIAGDALALALKRPDLLRWLERATGCESLRSTFGRVTQIAPGAVHRLGWHDDLPEDPTRRLAITINLSENAYEGGLFELRFKKTRQLLARHRHEVPGSVLIFDVSDELEHRVWPITAGGPRRMFTGWFLAGAR